ncbi:heavy-metal resistance protein [Sphingomonas sp. PP-CE-3G-477]|uniref:periplasmic heavy metal sensor n=1 Tax=unclassified Sphingomonas TaxID=196159 RepID=UPI000D3A5B95|nr:MULTISPECIES: periplasmic heavy metal sensor [unclassified Sphingomonas]MBD8617314.1 periplasmic heavy metal sensor [Sphingomonas sp. CFBP 13728]PTQ64955.1 heavy-metal resistance protein [Sphingomonas sp. PP-CE-3G-477]
MTAAVRRNLLTMLLAFLAALAGVVIGCRIMLPHGHRGSEIHALIHANIELDARQDAAIDALEADFSVTRQRYEAQLRADNAHLASAIAEEHGNGPKVAAAIDRSHHDMGELQKATLAHVFAMRRVLRPDQAATFDTVVVRALTSAP